MRAPLRETRPALVDRARPVLTIVCSGAGGAAADVKSALEQCSNKELARKLLDVVRISSGKVIGTPGSMRSFRSKMRSAAYAFGPFTAFNTYNPSESHSDAVMAAGGRPYGFNEYGHPDDRRPDGHTRLEIVSNRPAAVAAYFMACEAAVDDVAYGWPKSEARQGCGDVLFGKV